MIKKITGFVTVGVLLLSTANFAALGENAMHNAVIKNLKNKVELKYGASLWREAGRNQMVRPGTSIRTGSLSRAELLYPDGSITRVGSRTSFHVLDKPFRAVRIESGKMWFKVAKKSAGLKIYSPTAVAAITGTEGFAQFGNPEPEKDADNSSVRLASSDKDSTFKVAAETNVSFNFGLEEGTADVYKVDVNGEPMGDATQVTMGQLLSFTDGNFILQNIGVEAIHDQNSDVSEPDAMANKPSDGNLGPGDTTTEDVPNNLNNNQDNNLSPTTGDLEIIIK